MEKRLLEIQKRQAELSEQAKDLEGEALDKALEEAKELAEEEKDIEKRSRLTSMFATNSIKSNAVEMPSAESEERSYGIDSVEYRNAFFKTIAGVKLTDSEKRAMTTGTSSAGYAVPTLTMNKIYEKIENESVVYNLVTVSHLRGNVVIPIEGTTNDVERKAEGADGSFKNDTIGHLTLGAKKYIKLVKLTCELENTAIDALEDYIVRKLARKLEQAFDHDIINGVDDNHEVTGILSTITPIDAKTAGTLTYEDVCALFAEIPATARKNAVVMMSTNTLYKQVKAVKDDQKRPIFDLDDNKVLGREVVECDDVPDGTIIFGDFAEYMFNWNKDAEIRKSEEAGFMSGDTAFRILALVDGGLANLGAMAALEIGTAGSGT